MFVLGLFALLGWLFAGYFYGEALSLRNDCAGLFPAIKDTIDYYDRVCVEGIEQDKLNRLMQQTNDLNVSIKT